MAATETFSSSGQDAIARTIDVREADLETPSYSHNPTAFEYFYEIDGTVRFVENGDYKRVSAIGVKERRMSNVLLLDR